MVIEPGSHIFIVTRDTYPVHRDYGFCATGKGEHESLSFQQFQHIEQQREWHDHVADLWNIRLGDYIFFYVTNEGFKGVYKASSKPFFDSTEIENVPASRPLRILIEPVRSYDVAVPEEVVFSSPQYQKIFWIWYFNKMRGRGRGCNPIDPDARNKLIELLMRRNHNRSPLGVAKQYPNKSPKDQQIRALEVSHQDGRKVVTEAALRATLLKAVADHDTSVEPIFGAFKNLEWYANNVPYHVAGKNVDILAYHRAEPFSASLPVCPRVQYSVIELKREFADAKDLLQLVNYSLWAGNQLAEGETYMIRPVLVAQGFRPTVFEALKHNRLGFKDIALTRYQLTGGQLRFEEIPAH